MLDYSTITLDAFVAIMDELPIGAILVGDRRRIVMVNRMIESIFGHDRQELVTKTCEFLIGDRHRGQHEQLCETFIEHDAEARPMGVGRDLYGLRKDGSDVPVEVGINPVVIGKGSYVLVSVVDISLRKAHEEQLRSLTDELVEKNKRNEDLIRQLDRQTMTDPLTGVLNRRGLQHALSRELAWVTRYDTSLLAVLLDIDDFKQVNDTHGHAVGDEVLKRIANGLRTSLRSVDCIARIGGDEFIILLAQTRLGDGYELAEKIRVIVAETRFARGDAVIRTTASLGLVQVTGDCSTVEELIRTCQFVLKSSKSGGKNRVSLAGDEDGVARSRKEEIIDALGRRESYRVVKQPIFALTDMSVKGYEFLSRLNDPVFEMPDDFFRLSKASDLLTIVDQHCLHNCVAAGEQVADNRWKHVNLYPTTLLETPADELFTDFFGDGAEDFCIEINENLLSSDPERLRPAVRELRRRGLRVAIDDVGFGQSALEHLVILEPDIIKIDRHIIIGLADDSGRRRSLDRLLKVVRSLKAEVIVEGVESEDDLGVIRSMGVELGQGFLLGRPE